MSLSQSWGRESGGEGWASPKMKKSEQRPRMLLQPDCSPDKASLDSPSNRREVPYVGLHGNAKSTEPPYMELRRSKSRQKPRMAGHIHAKPWTISCQPGKKENKQQSTEYNRVWLIDEGTQGRWNRQRKTEYYDKLDSDLHSLRPHDEKFAHGSNYKAWTHLVNGGTHRGGLEKLNYVPKWSTDEPPEESKKHWRVGGGLHLRNNIYTGRFENVQHKAIILSGQKGRKGPDGLKQEGYVLDDRPLFDNRLKDDMIRRNADQERKAAEMNFDVHRPVNTRSCPQMGVDYMSR